MVSNTWNAVNVLLPGAAARAAPNAEVPMTRSRFVPRSSPALLVLFAAAAGCQAPEDPAGDEFAYSYAQTSTSCVSCAEPNCNVPTVKDCGEIVDPTAVDPSRCGPPLPLCDATHVNPANGPATCRYPASACPWMPAIVMKSCCMSATPCTPPNPDPSGLCAVNNVRTAADCNGCNANSNGDTCSDGRVVPGKCYPTYKSQATITLTEKPACARWQCMVKAGPVKVHCTRYGNATGYQWGIGSGAFPLDRSLDSSTYAVQFNACF